ncbi:hypothetical protein IW147_005472, partial [Coemansia sp. RSA 720]
MAISCTCVLSEAIQRVLTTRAFEWSDVAANFLGASAFLFAAWMADTWIVQPRAGVSGTQYWALDDTQASADFEMDDGDFDLELDDIFVASPPPESNLEP